MSLRDELEDILFEFPELDSFLMDDLENLDETELEDLIAEFDSLDRFDIPSRLKENIRDISLSDREAIKERFSITDGQFDSVLDLQRRVKTAESQARRNASDSGMKSLNQGSLSNPTLEVQFVTRRDDRVCPICEDIDGDTFNVDPTTGIIDGPLIPDDLHHNCRCRYLNLDGVELLLG